MTYILGRLQLKYGATSIPRFIEIMSNAKKGLEAAGWKLEGSFSSSSGRVYEVLDLWKVESYDKAQEGVLAEFARNPEFVSWMDKLTEIVEVEYTQILTKLDV